MFIITCNILYLEGKASASREGLIKQVLFPHPEETFERRRPQERNSPRIFSGLDCRKHFLRAYQGARPVDLEIPGKETAKRADDLDPEKRRVQLAAILQEDARAAADTSFVGETLRCELHGKKLNAIYSPAIEIICKLPSADPGRAEELEGGTGPAADAHIRALDHCDPGIKNSFGDAPQVGRRVYPLQSRLIEPGIPAVSLHLHDMQLRPDGVLPIEKSRELSDGHTVANREGKVSGKGLHLPVHHRPLYQCWR